MVDDMRERLVEIGYDPRSLSHSTYSYIMSSAQFNGLCDDDDTETCRRVMGDLFYGDLFT